MPELIIIRADYTRSKARFKEWRLGKQAGYNISFNDVRVIRAPEYDDQAKTMKPGIINTFLKEELDNA